MPDRSIKSAERTIALFELFSATESPLTVSEISVGLGVPQSSTTMLLRNLVNIGYLDFNRSTRRYKPTIRIILLSSWVTRRFNETSQVAGALDRLHEATGELVMLGLQHSAQAQAILARGPDRSGLQYALPARQKGNGRLMIRSGLFASLTCSAMGRALLSLKPDHEVRTWTRRSNAEAEDVRLKIPEGEMLGILQEVRRLGYAETHGTQRPDLGAFAIAMPSPMDSTPLAVSVSMPLHRMDQKREMIVEKLYAFRDQFAATGLDEDDEWSPL